MARLLLARGAKPIADFAQRRTPLMAAAHEGFGDCVAAHMRAGSLTRSARARGAGVQTMTRASVWSGPVLTRMGRAHPNGAGVRITCAACPDYVRARVTEQEDLRAALESIHLPVPELEQYLREARLFPASGPVDQHSPELFPCLPSRSLLSPFSRTIIIYRLHLSSFLTPQVVVWDSLPFWQLADLPPPGPFLS